jgi:hypothetical protein
MGFLIGWGSPKRFALWNGYRPEPRPDPLDFNWDRTTRITVTSMPGYINTVWGGWYLAWQEGSAGYVKLGYALRAGWVQEKTGGIEGVAEGSASITAALGGVIDLKLYGERLEPDARWVLVSDALQLPEAGGTGTPQPNPDAMLQVDAQAALHQLAVAMRLPDVDVFGLVAFDVQGELRGKILGCDVATAKLDARFHLAVCGGSGGPAIARMWGYFFAQLSFNLGCGEVDVVKVRLDFVFIGGECPSRTLRPLPPPQGISA